MPFTKFRHALRGAWFVLRRDSSVQIHSFIALLVIAAGIIGCISPGHWLFLFIAIFFVLAMELVNSALEHLADNLHPGRHPGVGEAKDIAAAAVLLAAIFSAIVGLFVFIPALIGGQAGTCLFF